MKLLVFLLAFSPIAARANFIDPATQQNISTAISICDTETQAAYSGLYTHFKITTIVAKLGQIRQLVDTVRPWQRQSTALNAIDSIDSRIDAEVAQAQSGRWGFYTLATGTQLMQEMKSRLQQLQGATQFGPPVPSAISATITTNK